MPVHVASQLGYRMDIDRNVLTVVECRPTDPGSPAGDWFDVYVAPTGIFFG
jgi:hypothetical protein